MSVAAAQNRRATAVCTVDRISKCCPKTMMHFWLTKSTINRIQTYKRFSLCRLWAEIEAHKWRDLELNLNKTATKAIEVGTSWSIKNARFALFITD